MTRLLPPLLAALSLATGVFAQAPRAAAAPAPAGQMATGGMVDLSLVEALAAIRQPQLAGLFSFIAEKDAPFAFADLVARDKGLMKRYLAKLADDRAAANGLTEWDHAVCASLVNLYNSPMAATFGKPDEKHMKQINECVLAPVVPLQEIVMRRKR